MIRSGDPRIRQRINQLSHNLESANESAQERLYTLSQNYISPCLAAAGNCVSICVAPCLPSREDQLRRRRRGRAEANFDFYDDWDNEEEDDSILGWGTGELDRLLAGSGLGRVSTEQPHRPRRMSYGTRRRSTVHLPDSHSDPTVIPTSSFIGFLQGFSWRFGAKGVKYRPSAADLQEHPGNSRRFTHEDEPLMEAIVDDDDAFFNDSGRNRSATQSSRETNNSLSSRGDLFPSDEEEDAVPLDDEFALTFSRRGTGLEFDEQSGPRPDMVRPASGTFSLGATSSKKPARKMKKKRSSTKSAVSTDQEIVRNVESPSIADLKLEEDRAALEEESRIEKKRVAAQELAMKRGLDLADADMSASPSNKDKHFNPMSLETPAQTEPFPPFPSGTSPRLSSVIASGSELDSSNGPNHDPAH